MKDGELKFCFSQCADNATLCVTLTTNSTLTSEGLIHGVITGVDVKLNDKASKIMASDQITSKQLVALQTLVDCPFSFRTHMTSVGLMVSHVKLAWGDTDSKEMLSLLNGMYKQPVPAELNIAPRATPGAVNPSQTGLTVYPYGGGSVGYGTGAVSGNNTQNEPLPTCPMPREVKQTHVTVRIQETRNGTFVLTGSVNSDAGLCGNVVERAERKITLQECIAMALEQGNVGIQTPTCTSSKLEVLPHIQSSCEAKTQSILSKRTDADVQINYLLANVEVAYWNLFAARQTLYAQEQGLSQAFLSYKFVKTRVEVGTVTGANQDQSPSQMERFRRMVIDARGQVLESERQLRGLLGMRNDDGTQLVPSDEPKTAAIVPDFQEAANEALANRPEIIQCRQDLKVQQLNLLMQRNLHKPEIQSTTPGNALAQMAAEKFENWSISGLRMTMSVESSDANAAIREAQLHMARSYYQCRDTELKVMEYLVQQYRQVIQTHAEIAPARAERVALEAYIKKIDTLIATGKWNPQDFLNYLTVQQQLATAIACESQAIADYNKAIATFEFAKGTIQKHHNLGVLTPAALPPAEIIAAPAPREVISEVKP